MSEWLLWVVGLCYVGTAIDLYLRGNSGLALAFLSYAIANLGLIMAARA
jgi:hypothetical protein